MLLPSVRRRRRRGLGGGVRGVRIEMKFLLILLATAAFAQLPNPKLTPGATLKVTREQVCEVGYTEKARRVSSKTKAFVFKEYGLTYDTASITRSTT
jgi:hypothetical protein